jgi:hypothetical protein
MRCAAVRGTIYLEGWTEAEIRKKLTLNRSRVAQILIDVKKGIDSQINIPASSQIGDVWLRPEA